jgi:NADH-quinone oxidoreductase subunit J
MMMNFMFYLHASVAVLAMGWAMLTPQAVHALLFAIMSLLSLAVAMYSLSAELAAVLEVVIYTGAIMVLFVFVVMLLKPERLSSGPPGQKKPIHLFLSFFVLAFLVELLFLLQGGFPTEAKESRPIADIATALFHRYGFYVEVISFILLAGFVTAIFVGKSLLVRGHLRRERQGISHDTP